MIPRMVCIRVGRVGAALLIGLGVVAGTAACGGDDGNTVRPMGMPSSLAPSVRPMVTRSLAVANGALPGDLRRSDKGMVDRPGVETYQSVVFQVSLLCPVSSAELQRLATQAKASWKSASLLDALKEIDLRMTAGATCQDAAAGQ